MYLQDFKRLCHTTGFIDPRIIDSHPIEIEDEELRDIVGEAKFYSITFRLFKLNTLETLCEDYGQYAVYHGTIAGYTSGYQVGSVVIVALFWILISFILCEHSWTTTTTW